MAERKKTLLERWGIIEIIYIGEPSEKSWIQRIFSDLWIVVYIDEINVDLNNPIYK